MIATTSQATSVPAVRPIHLAVGQTSFDGQFTLTTMRTVYGALRILLKNNGRHAIMVDSYRLSGETGSDCQGAALRIDAYTSDQLCTVVPLGGVRTPIPAIFGKTGHKNDVPSQSLQLILTWHPLTRLKAIETPSPSPSPLASPTG